MDKYGDFLLKKSQLRSDDGFEPLPEPFERKIIYPLQPRQAHCEFVKALDRVGLWK